MVVLDTTTHAAPPAPAFEATAHAVPGNRAQTGVDGRIKSDHDDVMSLPVPVNVPFPVMVVLDTTTHAAPPAPASAATVHPVPGNRAPTGVDGRIKSDHDDVMSPPVAVSVPVNVMVVLDTTIQAVPPAPASAATVHPVPGNRAPTSVDGRIKSYHDDALSTPVLVPFPVMVVLDTTIHAPPPAPARAMTARRGHNATDKPS